MMTDGRCSCFSESLWRMIRTLNTNCSHASCNVRIIGVSKPSRAPQLKASSKESSHLRIRMPLGSGGLSIESAACYVRNDKSMSSFEGSGIGLDRHSLTLLASRDSALKGPALKHNCIAIYTKTAQP